MTIPAWLLVLYPLLAPALGARRRALWREQITARHSQARASRLLEKLVKQLDQESVLFGRIIISTLARLGYAHTPAGRNGEDRPRRRKRQQRVKIEIIRYNDLAIYYKLLVRQRTLFGPAKDALPARVTLAKMMNEETCLELSGAIERRVTWYHSPTNGAWFIVHRQSFGGMLPRHVAWSDMLVHFQIEKLDDAPMILGIGENNKLFEMALEASPHTLLSGASQSGKSNLLNSILSTWTLFATAAQMQFLLIDPKQVEFAFYDDVAATADTEATPGIPHRYGGKVLTDISEAIGALHQVRAEMMRRLTLIRSRRVKKFSELNAISDHPLPRIVVVVEELSGLYGVVAGKQAAEAQRLLIDLANMGRAAGVHMLLVTQVPKKEIIPGELKANMVCIAGRVSSTTASMVILGTGDAAWLDPIPGRMIVAPSADRFAIQAAHIRNDEVDWCCSVARGRAAGLLTLDKLTPVPVADAILMDQIENDKGRLAPRRYAERRQWYGITEALVSPIMEEVKKQEQIVLGGKVYRRQRDENGFWLKLDAEANLTPVEIASSSTGSTVEEQPESKYPTAFVAMQAFITECIEPSEEMIDFSVIRARADEWIEANSAPAFTGAALGKALGSAGFEKVRSEKSRGWKVRLN